MQNFNFNVYNILSIIVCVFALIYVFYVDYRLPNVVKNLFNNMAFRALIILLIAYIANQHPLVAIIVAVVFTVTISMLQNRKVKEEFVIKKNFLQLGSSSLDVSDCVQINDSRAWDFIKRRQCLNSKDKCRWTKNNECVDKKDINEYIRR